MSVIKAGSLFYSQAGQDRFVYQLLVEGESLVDGTFLDVGCSDPILINNTYALEQIGWRGFLVDQDVNLTDRIRTRRESPYVCGDALQLDWRALLTPYGKPCQIDYLSFDLDTDGLQGLVRLPLDVLRFRVMTVEHDFYRFGDGPRRMMRETLKYFGYELLCPDVMNDGLQFEDWWVDLSKVNVSLAEHFRTKEPTDWRNIVSRV